MTKCHRREMQRFTDENLQYLWARHRQRINKDSTVVRNNDNFVVYGGND